MLANIYLHYVFDLWVNQWRRKTAQGDVIVVRYADDAVLGFEHRSEAEAFLEQLRERMQKFGLELHPEKTRLIEFGRFAEEDRRRRGEGKPETFDFLGFTHSCGKTKKGNWFTIRRQTAKKRLRSKLQAVKQELGKRWHKRVVENGKWLRSVVQGYFNYRAVPGSRSLLRLQLPFQQVDQQHLHAAVQLSQISLAHVFDFFGDVLDVGLLQLAGSQQFGTAPCPLEEILVVESG